MNSVSIYDFSSSYEYLAEWIASRPNSGRGIKGQFAKVLGVSSTLISFILSGKKTATLEQASDLADFMGLNEAETDFLFLLIELERANHHRLRTKLKRKVNQALLQSKKISVRVKKDIELSEEKKAIYYSSWIYTATRNLVATGVYRDALEIARRLNVSQVTVSKALHFLLENGLCEEKNGQIVVGPTYTHVDSDSPHVNKHRQNWRLLGFSMMEQKNEKDIFYTSPMSLSEVDAEKVRGMILKYIDEVLAVMRPSPSEKVYCLNMDWFEF